MKNNILEYNVDKKAKLLDFLYEVVNKPKKNIKAFLKNECVYVNERVVRKHDFILEPKDKIVIKLFHTSLDILYEDEYLIIVSKPSGLLTISTSKEKERTLYKEVSSYVKKNIKNKKIFIVNRLDKDTSGIVVFAKDKKTKEILQTKWNDIVSVRKYVAIVNGVTDEKGIIKSYLSENKEHIVYSSNKGKLAITEYEKVKCNSKYSMLNIYLYTGRKNQIRVHMKDIGHSIVGDMKYGYKDDSKRLMLHCEYIEFINPVNNKLIKVKSKYPSLFDDYFK